MILKDSDGDLEPVNIIEIHLSQLNFTFEWSR